MGRDGWRGSRNRNVWRRIRKRAAIITSGVDIVAFVLSIIINGGFQVSFFFISPRDEVRIGVGSAVNVFEIDAARRVRVRWFFIYTKVVWAVRHLLTKVDNITRGEDGQNRVVGRNSDFLNTNGMTTFNFRLCTASRVTTHSLDPHRFLAPSYIVLHDANPPAPPPLV